ncbi:DEAD-domain-containing protein [Coprinopsis marcescibilis]|uniref:RNA helicase n=1 Tax=Coprinopsis marcescibilis TaxID=230819 RepID=A0A5C3KJ19_COPMA|nr:DEAD-domain-containing protein [Coprinopsis marcescibilis]
MSNDTEVVAAVSKEERKRLKKLEKEKKKKEKAVEEPSEDAMVVNDEAAEAKNSKKEKKRKEKKEKVDVDSPESNENDGSSVAVDAKVVNGSGSSTQTEETSSKRSKKDKKKRKREGEEGGEDEAVKEGKKDKKQRRKEKEASTQAESSCSSSSSFAPTTPEAAEAFLTKHSITITLPGTSVAAKPLLPIISFDQLTNLPEKLRTESFKGFKEPSPIQACTWPPAFEGRDLVGIAETGSGKTLAFGIPALSRLISSKSTAGITTLVVAPTRELAIQTHDSLSHLGKSWGIASVAVYGGVSKDGQIKMLKASLKNGVGKDGLRTRIVVGTPGRILDLINDGVLDLSGVDYLVLDEADRMLDKGFENDIRRIIAETKPIEERQTMMFSATWPEAVRRLASTFQREPVRVTVGSDDLTANSRVEQEVEVFDDNRSKDQRLTKHLRNLLPNKNKKPAEDDISRILVFALYKKEASRVEEVLQRQGYSVGALHGDMSQANRIEALDNFKSGRTQVLVATDVAARGLDIPNVGVVINYTFPLTIEDYIHRIGRTGRGGKFGKSITFFTGDNHERSLAGEFARVLSDGGFDNAQLREKFPMTIKKREHGVYGAFYRDDIPVPKGPTKITF